MGANYMQSYFEMTIPRARYRLEQAAKELQEEVGYLVKKVTKGDVVFNLNRILRLSQDAAEFEKELTTLTELKKVLDCPE
jgi:hypothetical protein